MSDDSRLDDPARGAGPGPTDEAAADPAVTVTAPAGPADSGGPADSAQAGTAAAGQGADLVSAVDALGTVSTEPVHSHAARYHEVHTRLQDALSATDRSGS
jgi:hypothetical protein